ncbi:juvenile hormone esterase-like [Diorhabda carinulata]|uniref:juvenile hormone esterase-like n=1 Tax=Diorhabda carinulata TaxID=1163345 RepID=UPI0025A22E53|nr:juvenile hormone esterase-like [Diorhabda carinulata]
MLKILLFVVLSFFIQIFCEDIDVTLPNGKIRGLKVTPVVTNLTYYSFLGIPFAAPPIGNLRFKPPQPVENWEGTLIADNNDALCYQVGKKTEHASEDCLYLNVYTPVVPSTSSSLPVLVFIYGGTFRRGRSFPGYKSPAFLMKENVVVVTFNYRVGPFGFLSTEDEVIPGNMGLKDQQFALKWVQQNINLFGGDPRQVTLMGQSAGSASVTYQLLSPGSAGLFRAAIGNSGSALCTWAFQRNAADIAYGIAAEIDPTFERNRTSEELLNFLSNVPASAIEDTADKYNAFAPVIEVPHVGALISDLMYRNAENGSFNKVPVLMGFNSEEALMMAEKTGSWRSYVRQYDKDLRTLVDDDMYITDSDKKLLVGKEIKKIYLNDTDMFADKLGESVQYFGDNRFIRPIIKFAELIRHHVDLYFYQFSYHGPLGGNSVEIPGIGKVAHAEDQNYFWVVHDNYDSFPDTDIKTLQRYVTLLTNFVKYLNPTPIADDLLQNITWPKATENDYLYLDIDTNLSIQTNPRNFSYSKWVDIYEENAAKPFISY